MKVWTHQINIDLPLQGLRSILFYYILTHLGQGESWHSFGIWVKIKYIENHKGKKIYEKKSLSNFLYSSVVKWINTKLNICII